MAIERYRMQEREHGEGDKRTVERLFGDNYFIMVTEADHVAVVARLRKEVYAAINVHQDLTSWQAGDSRNELICDIRDKVDGLFETLATLES